MARKLIHNRNGIVLPLVLVIAAVLGILVLTVITLSYSDNMNSANHQDNTQAYYLARSGADALGTYIVDQSKILSPIGFDNLISNMQNHPSEKTYLATGDKGYFEISVVRSGVKIYVTATGTVNNSQKEVTLVIAQSSENFFQGFDHALFVGNNLTFTGSTRVLGSVMSNFNASNQLNFDSSGGQYISGDLYVTNSQLAKSSFNYGTTKIQGNVLPLPEQSVFTLPPFPVYPDQSTLPVFNSLYTAGWNPSPPYYMATDGWYKGGINILSELIITVGNTDRIIRTKFLTISGSGKLTINKTGSGRLILYIDDKTTTALSMTNGAQVNANGDPGDMQIYFDAPSFSVTGSVILKSLLYGKNTAITIGNGGSVFGHVITGSSNVVFSGDATAYVQAIFAPNAFVDFSGSGKVKGVVIANTCALSGSSYIEFASLAQDQNLAKIFGKTVLAYEQWR
ncbi:MAG: pilus assembly PilX N-terminal domain-containing protein [Clostridia bacterium]